MPNIEQIVPPCLSLSFKSLFTHHHPQHKVNHKINHKSPSRFKMILPANTTLWNHTLPIFIAQNMTRFTTSISTTTTSPIDSGCSTCGHEQLLSFASGAIERDIELGRKITYAVVFPVVSLVLLVNMVSFNRERLEGWWENRKRKCEDYRNRRGEESV